MPYNNFKLFDSNKANMLSDTEYSNATQRLNGVQTGVASSQLQNKFAYQVSLVALAITQIMNQNGLDATDTLSVSAFVGNLGGALLQKVADKASSAEAAAGVLTNKYISPATMKAAALLLSGGVMTGTLNMNNNKIINLPTPTLNSEPATKGYVDGEGTKYLKTIKGSYIGGGGAGHQVVINYVTKPKMIFICSNNSTSETFGATTILADNNCYIGYGKFNNSIGIYSDICTWENNRIVIVGNYLIDYFGIEYNYVMVY